MLGIKLDWLPGGGVKTTSGPIAGVKTDHAHGRKVWFNSMVAAYTGWEDERNESKKAVTYGNGSALPAEAVEACLKILTEESVAIPWKKGDVLLLDNIQVQHARRPFTLSRRVLASLTK